MHRRAKTQRRWQEAIKRQKVSGLSIKDFCEQSGLNEPSFYVWRKRLGMSRSKEEKTATLPEDHRDKQIPSKILSKGFMRLMPPAAESRAIRIETANGYKVDTGHVGEDGLRNVLRVLQAL